MRARQAENLANMRGCALCTVRACERIRAIFQVAETAQFK